jgi:hypothetical protein
MFSFCYLSSSNIPINNKISTDNNTYKIIYTQLYKFYIYFEYCDFPLQGFLFLVYTIYIFLNSLIKLVLNKFKWLHWNNTSTNILIIQIHRLLHCHQIEKVNCHHIELFVTT